MEMAAKEVGTTNNQGAVSGCIQGQNLWKRLQVQTQVLQNKYDIEEINSMLRIKDSPGQERERKT